MKPPRPVAGGHHQGSCIGDMIEAILGIGVGFQSPAAYPVHPRDGLSGRVAAIGLYDFGADAFPAVYCEKKEAFMPVIIGTRVERVEPWPITPDRACRRPQRYAGAIRRDDEGFLGKLDDSLKPGMGVGASMDGYYAVPPLEVGVCGYTYFSGGCSHGETLDHAEAQVQEHWAVDVARRAAP